MRGESEHFLGIRRKPKVSQQSETLGSQYIRRYGQTLYRFALLLIVTFDLDVIFHNWFLCYILPIGSGKVYPVQPQHVV